MADLTKMWQSEGYCFIRKLPTGEYAALRQFMFTIGLVVGLDLEGYRCRWCYDNAYAAMSALEKWNGEDDPPGPWIKQKGRLLDGKVVDRNREQPLFR